MESLNRPWNWIWVMALIWMVWSSIMAILFFFNVAEFLVFHPLTFSIWLIIFSCYVWDLSVSKSCSGMSVWRSSTLLTQYNLTWYFRDDEKSLLWSDFIFVLDSGRQTCYTLCLCDVLVAIVLSVTKMVYVNDVFWFLWITKTGIFSSEKYCINLLKSLSHILKQIIIITINHVYHQCDEISNKSMEFHFIKV